MSKVDRDAAFEGPTKYIVYECHGCKWLKRDPNRGYVCQHAAVDPITKIKQRIDVMGRTPLWCPFRSNKGGSR